MIEGKTMAEGKKINVNKKTLITVLAVVLVVIALVGIAAGVLKSRREKAIKIAGCSFSTDGFDSVTEVKDINEAFAVFTTNGEKFGIMTLDGTVTSPAEQDRIYTVSDAFRSIKYVAEGPLSEYKLLIDAESGTVTGRQYHGITSPEKTPCWDETSKHLAWMDSTGYAGEVRASELALDEGLYPVTNTISNKAKYGFINEYLQLEIDMIYDAAGDFSEGLAPVKKSGSWIYIDTTGKEVITTGYSPISDRGAYGFRNGLVPVKKDGKCGIINKKGETVVKFNFEEIIQGKDGKYIAKKDGKWGVLTVNEDIFNRENTTVKASEEQTGEMVSGNYRVRTSGSTLNLRATADSSSAIVSRIPNGTVITVTKTVPGWAYTVYNSAEGWVSMDYIESIE